MPSQASPASPTGEVDETAVSEQTAPTEPAASADRLTASEPAEEHTPGATASPVGRPARPALLDELRHVNWSDPKTAWRQVVELIGVTKLVIGGALLVLVLAGFLLPGGERSDPFDGPGAAMDLIVKLGAVLALAYVSLAALRKYTAGSASQRGTLLEVLDSTTLGPNKSVYVVRAGGKRLVLGVTQNQITPLAELTEPDETGEITTGEIAPAQATTKNG
jgi:flagellar biosynthetic protein FliO